MDFNIKTYKELITTLINNNYKFITFEQYCKGMRPQKYVILRHDVDLLPDNSLRFAKIQAALNIKGSYYFRAVPESWDKQVIKAIDALGHEVGYHYECLTTTDGNINTAITDFDKNLKALRQLVDVSTICMHGSPRSPYDSKDLWQNHSYQAYNIIGEPYFDADFDDMFYLTDTGRRWDGWKVSVRDKVPQQEDWRNKGWIYHSTQDIIDAISGGTLPNKIMFTFHPQRWHDNAFPWVKELFLQNAKNIVKRYMIK